MYDSVYKKLEEKLATKKHRMAKIIADSNRAYEVRDRLLSKLNDLKKQVDEEQSAFESEWAKLGNAISVETGGRDARKRGWIVGRPRRSRRCYAKSCRRRTTLEEKVVSGAWKIAKEKAHLALR